MSISVYTFFCGWTDSIMNTIINKMNTKFKLLPLFATIVHIGGDKHKDANYRFDRNDDGGDD